MDEVRKTCDERERKEKLRKERKKERKSGAVWQAQQKCSYEHK